MTPGDEDMAASFVDAAMREVRAETADADERHRAILAEAALARLVDLVEERLVTPTGRESARMHRPFWSAVARDLERRTGLDAVVVLVGLQRLVLEKFRRPLDELAARRAELISGEPAWVRAVGAATLVEAVITDDLAGDGYNVVLAYDDGAEGHTLVVYVDNNLGAIAKDVFPGPPMTTVRRAYEGQDGVIVRPTSLPEAVGHVVAALERTAAAEAPFVTTDFDRFGSLLTLRMAAAPVAPEWPPPPPEVSLRTRREIVERFLDSGLVAEQRHPRELVAWIARHWVDHAVDRTVGGPLRVSAVLVELFLVDWVPRCLRPTEPGCLAAIPEVVRDWLRFAADQTPIPRDQLDSALAAVEHWAPVMRRRCTDPAAWELPIEVLAPEPDEDELEALWFSLPGLGPAPMPDVTGLDSPARRKLVQLARGSWVLAGEQLGTDFAGRAFALAERLVRERPELLARGLLRTWQAAIVWVIAEDEYAVDRGPHLAAIAPNRLAADLNSTAKTLREKAAAIRAALGLPRD